jgi:hypothetical protein
MAGLLPFRLQGQFIRTGSIDGQVLDASNSAVPRAKVTATATATSQKIDVYTDTAGRYIFNYLPIGEHRIEVQQSGFQTSVQTVIVELGRRFTANFALEVETSKQSVVVKAEVPVLETTTASVNTLLTNDIVRNIPMNGRQSTMMWPRVSGTMTVFRDDGRHIAENNYSSRISVSGARINQNFFLMDGVANNQAGQINYIPPVDQVQEMNVVANAFDAEYGNAAGAVVSVVSKSGTSQFHGTVYDYVRNDKFDATAHDRKQAGLPKSRLRWNQFGAAAGGPLIKSKTFWFGNYEGFRWPQRAQTKLYTVPTNLERQGNFSQTVDSAGRPFQIYDPFSTRASTAPGGGLIRDLFPGNTIPAARISAPAKGILSILPEANRAGRVVGGRTVENLTALGPADYWSHNWGVRVDQNLRAHRLFGRGSRSTTIAEDCQSRLAAFGCNKNARMQNSGGIGDAFTLTPSTVVNMNFGVSRWTEYDAPVSPFTPSDVGFSSAFVGLLPDKALLPSIDSSDFMSMGVNDQDNWYTFATYSYSGTVTQVRGRHNLKAGYFGLTNQNNSQGSGWRFGQFSFNRGFTQGPDPNTAGSNLGYGLASFLLGTPASGSLARPANAAAQHRVNGWFI